MATFVRFAGCPFRCSYCDTRRAQKKDSGRIMTVDEIVNSIIAEGCENVTLTGGDPLYQSQDDLKYLLRELTEKRCFKVSIETNGFFSVEPYEEFRFDVSFVMDYKLKGSGMDGHMKDENFVPLWKNDFIKFVITSIADYSQAKEVMRRLRLQGCEAKFAFSPCHGGKFDAAKLIEEMKNDRITDCIVNLQIHKYIWPEAGEKEV